MFFIGKTNINDLTISHKNISSKRLSLPQSLKCVSRKEDEFAMLSGIIQSNLEIHIGNLMVIIMELE